MYRKLSYVGLGRFTDILKNRAKAIGIVATWSNKTNIEIEFLKECGDHGFFVGRTCYMFLSDNETLAKFRITMLNVKESTSVIRVSAKYRKVDLSRTEKFICLVKGIKYL